MRGLLELRAPNRKWIGPALSEATGLARLLRLGRPVRRTPEGRSMSWGQATHAYDQHFFRGPPGPGSDASVACEGVEKRYGAGAPSGSMIPWPTAWSRAETTAGTSSPLASASTVTSRLIPTTDPNPPSGGWPARAAAPGGHDVEDRPRDLVPLPGAVGMARASCSTKNGLPLWCDDTARRSSSTSSAIALGAALQTLGRSGGESRDDPPHALHLSARTESRHRGGAHTDDEHARHGLATGWTAAVASAERPGERPRVTVAG